MYDQPADGEKWLLKRDNRKVVTVTKVDKIGKNVIYVHLEMPWAKNGISGKSIDYFLKHYEPIKK